MKTCSDSQVKAAVEHFYDPRRAALLPSEATQMIATRDPTIWGSLAMEPCVVFYYCGKPYAIESHRWAADVRKQVGFL